MLQLRLGSIPVRVQGWFILMALFLGMNERQPARLAAWVVIVVVSVVIHELGHALMGKAFGLMPSIELHGMGGTTSFQAREGEEERAALGTWKSVAVSLAGPFAGFGFALVIVGVQLAGFHPTHPLAIHALSLLYVVNIGWGIFNLLPMLPLDGGNVLRSITTAIAPVRGDAIARVISIAIAVGIALLAIKKQQWWVLYLGVLFAFRNVQSLRQAGQLRVDQALVDAIEGGYRALDRNEPKAAIALLEPLLSSPASTDLRQVGVQIYVVSMLREQMWPEAVATIEREHAVISKEDLSRYAALMREQGRFDDAVKIEALEKAPAPLAEFRT